MSDCERCGEKIGLVPRICWKCFYEFWNARTPEQKQIVRQLQQAAVDKFRASLAEEMNELLPSGSNEVSMTIDGRVWLTESIVKSIIWKLDKELYA